MDLSKIRNPKPDEYLSMLCNPNLKKEVTDINLLKQRYEEDLFLSILNTPRIIEESDDLVLPDIDNFDETYSYLNDAILVNRIPLENNYMQSIIETICDNSEKLSLVPSCQCEYLKSEFYQTTKTPIICPKCKTQVKATISSDIKNDVWIDVPYVFKGGVIQPQIFKLLAEWLKVGKDKKRSYLHLILDPKEEIPEDLAPYIKGKGFNYLYENFDYIMNFFLDIYPKTSTNQNKFMMKLLLNKYRDRIWCTKLPILSSILQPITRQGHSLQYANSNVRSLLEAIVNLIDISISEKTSLSFNRRAEKVMYNVYSEYLNYTSYIVDKRLGSKPGLFRQHIYGTRLHCSFRGVITPISGEHYGDELHLPWKIGLNTYKYYALSGLINRKPYRMNEAYNKLMRAFNKYDPEIDRLFQELIDECPFKGFPVLFNRNPSLRIESIRLLFATKIKPGIKNDAELERKMALLNQLINDESIGFSDLITTGFNADFDGDELNGVALLEMDSVTDFFVLHPLNGMISPITGQMDTDVAIPYPLVINLNNWLRG